MFEIGQIVVTKNSGVCRIINKEKKDFGIGENIYLVLQPYFQTANSTLLYIPEDKASFNIRQLINKQQALSLIDDFPNINRVWYSDSKIRHQKFEEMYKSGDLKKLCQLMKSLYLQNQDLKESKKTLSLIDLEFLNKLQTSLYQELSIALSIDINEINDFIKSRITV